MRLRLPLLSLALLAGSIATAHATPVTFTASGSFDSGSQLTGTVTFDPSTGQFLSSNLSTTGPNAYTFSFLFGPPNNPCDFPTLGDCEFSFAVAGGGIPDLNLLVYPLTNLIGYNGGVLASETNPGNYISDMYFGNDINGNGIFDGLVVGSLTPISTTPEPSTLALLGTGIFGVVGLARRRLR